jgi:hypothetical protein
LKNTLAWTRGPDGRPARITNKREADNSADQRPGKSFDAWIQQVNECNRAVDEGVGRVLAALEESGQKNSTLAQVPQYSPNAPHFSGRQVESRHYI